MNSEEKTPGNIGFVKKLSLAVIAFLLMMAVGCNSPAPSVRDKLNEVDEELRGSVTRILMSVDRLEYLARELSYIDAAFDAQLSALNIRNDLLEQVSNISAVKDRLREIGEELAR